MKSSMTPLNRFNWCYVLWRDAKWKVAEISMAAVTPHPVHPISHVRVKVSDPGVKYSPFWLIWATSYPTWNTDEGWKSCMTAHPNNEATQKNTNSAELDVCFSSVWACNYFALFSSFQCVLGGVGTAWCLWQLSCKGDVGHGYMLTQLVGFWL